MTEDPAIWANDRKVRGMALHKFTHPLLENAWQLGTLNTKRRLLDVFFCMALGLRQKGVGALLLSALRL